MKKNTLVYLSLLSLVLLVVGFLGGIKYQQSKSTSKQFGGAVSGRMNGQLGGQTGRPGGARSAGFRPIIGEITDQSGSSITVKLIDGSSKIVFISSNTQLFKANPATSVDLKVGHKVSVMGMENASGVSAQSIQIDPPMSTPSAINK